MCNKRRFDIITALSINGWRIIYALADKFLDENDLKKLRGGN